MTTLHAWLLVLWGRARCWAIGAHVWRLRSSHGYRAAWCERCWRGELEAER